MNTALVWQDDTEAAEAWITQLRGSGGAALAKSWRGDGAGLRAAHRQPGRNLMEGRLGILTAVVEAVRMNT